MKTRLQEIFKCMKQRCYNPRNLSFQILKLKEIKEYDNF